MPEILGLLYLLFYFAILSNVRWSHKTGRMIVLHIITSTTYSIVQLAGRTVAVAIVRCSWFVPPGLIYLKHAIIWYSKHCKVLGPGKAYQTLLPLLWAGWQDMRLVSPIAAFPGPTCPSFSGRSLGNRLDYTCIHVHVLMRDGRSKQARSCTCIPMWKGAQSAE